MGDGDDDVTGVYGSGDAGRCFDRRQVIVVRKRETYNMMGWRCKGVSW